MYICLPKAISVRLNLGQMSILIEEQTGVKMKHVVRFMILMLLELDLTYPWYSEGLRLSLRNFSVRGAHEWERV